MLHDQLCPIALLRLAWGTTRFDRGVATVNLLLNRASPWINIDSCLPIGREGRSGQYSFLTASRRIPNLEKTIYEKYNLNCFPQVVLQYKVD